MGAGEAGGGSHLAQLYRNKEGQEDLRLISLIVNLFSERKKKTTIKIQKEKLHKPPSERLAGGSRAVRWSASISASIRESGEGPGAVLAGTPRWGEISRAGPALQGAHRRLV